MRVADGAYGSTASLPYEPPISTTLRRNTMCSIAVQFALRFRFRDGAEFEDFLLRDTLAGVQLLLRVAVPSSEQTMQKAKGASAAPTAISARAVFVRAGDVNVAQGAMAVQQGVPMRAAVVAPVPVEVKRVRIRKVSRSAVCKRVSASHLARAVSVVVAPAHD